MLEKRGDKDGWLPHGKGSIGDTQSSTANSNRNGGRGIKREGEDEEDAWKGRSTSTKDIRRLT